MEDEQWMRRAIAAKRDGETLAPESWERFVRTYLTGGIDDAQAAAMFMACVWRGLESSEIAALTEAYVESGDRLLVDDELPVVDKHSSGGVADTASLIVVPLLAACGVRVAKLAGRALGHTGGTIDKLEAIAGVRTDLDPERFLSQVREVGCAIAAQTARLVPADKRIYALRDHTGTVPSLGLIAASIVSKKIAGGAGAIVYDVKAGCGAFMRTPSEASELARVLVEITGRFDRRASALVTDMNEPLGVAIGTGLEAIEARDALRGERFDARLRAVCEALAIAALRTAGRASDAEATVTRVLSDGSAYERFERMLHAQGAHPGALDALRPHPSCVEACAERTGFVAAIDAPMLGECARELVERDGSGAGIVVRVRIGDRVERGAPLAVLHGSTAGAVRERVARAFSLAEERPPARELIYLMIGEARSTLETR